VRHLPVAAAASRWKSGADCEDIRDAPEYLGLKACGVKQQAANVAGRITCTVRARLEKTKVVMDASTHAFQAKLRPNYLKQSKRIGLIKPRRGSGELDRLPRAHRLMTAAGPIKPSEEENTEYMVHKNCLDDV
jgi:hypothetical protein